MTKIHEIEALVGLMAKLPGFGPRSARRAVLHLIKRKDHLMQPLIDAMNDVKNNITVCTSCGNLDTKDICFICTDEDREGNILAVVADVDDLWALERTHVFKGRYHVLGGVLSVLEGVSPDKLRIDSLLQRMKKEDIKEVILALSATVDSHTTAFYLQEKLQPLGVKVTRLSHGVPVGGELDYLDDGTLITALKSRTLF